MWVWTESELFKKALWCLAGKHKRCMGSGLITGVDVWMWRLHGGFLEGAQGIMMNGTGLRLRFLWSILWVWIAHTACQRTSLCVAVAWVCVFFPPTHAIMWPSLIHSALNWRNCAEGFLLQSITYYMSLFDMNMEAILIQLKWCKYIISVIKKKLKWWVTRAIGGLTYPFCHKRLLMLTQQKHSVAE